MQWQLHFQNYQMLKINENHITQWSNAIDAIHLRFQPWRMRFFSRWWAGKGACSWSIPGPRWLSLGRTSQYAPANEPGSGKSINSNGFTFEKMVVLASRFACQRVSEKNDSAAVGQFRSQRQQPASSASDCEIISTKNTKSTQKPWVRCGGSDGLQGLGIGERGSCSKPGTSRHFQVMVGSQRARLSMK